MTTDLIQFFTFPSPGPVLPPAPAAIFPPVPIEFPGIDERYYLEASLRNTTLRPTEGFGSIESSIRSYDLVETRWFEPSQSRTVYEAISIFCLVCDEGTTPPASNPWEACDNYTAGVTESSSTLVAAPRSGKDVRFQIPRPDENEFDTGNERKGHNKTMACMFSLELIDIQANATETKNMAISQLFLVKNKPRRGALYFSETSPYLYNSANPTGTPTGGDRNSPTYVGLLPSSTRAAAPRVCLHSGRGTTCGTSGWVTWSVGKRVGIVIGSVIGFVIVCFFFWICTRRTRFAETRERPKPMLLSEYRAEQRLRAEGQRDDSESSVAGGLRAEEPPVERPVPARRETDGVDIAPPPAYHEVVKEQDRRDRHDQVQPVDVSGPHFPPPASVNPSSPPIPAPSYETQAQR
ncbi:hypothetical protein IQ07DRAFT_412264 [Pyrenochaeta sp. DS3sAY3a]|nr:hypothetical protein IQ07DRAFT_412264 [Pyrenochaeta sp. DS3sAY3a]